MRTTEEIWLAVRNFSAMGPDAFSNPFFSKDIDKNFESCWKSCNDFQQLVDAVEFAFKKISANPPDAKGIYEWKECIRYFRGQQFDLSPRSVEKLIAFKQGITFLTG